MKLFYSPTSPYARKVRMLAIAKGLDAQIELLSVNVSVEQPELFAANPLGKVPSLLLDDGEALFDSPVICRYLDSLSGAPLIPTLGWSQWQVLRWEALADGLMDASYNLVMEQRSRPEHERSPNAMARWRTEIERTLAHIEKQLDTLSDELNHAHIALGAALGYLEFRLPELLQQAGGANTLAWYGEFRELPMMQETMPG